MRRACLALLVVVASTACGGPRLQERPPDLSKHLPATLEASRPQDGAPRVAKVRVWADAGVRALPRWREEIVDQLDYASQLLRPLLGIELALDDVHEWARAGEPQQALTQLAVADAALPAAATGPAWVIGYATANDTAGRALFELGQAELLGRYVVVRGWAETAESRALGATLPDLAEGDRAEILAAHRRHKQTVVLLHQLAITLGAIAETEPAQLQHPLYTPKQTAFSERNRELMAIAVADRLAEVAPAITAGKLRDAIEKAAWGGWVASDQEQVLGALRNRIAAAQGGATAADVPAAAFDQYTRIVELAKRGKPDEAVVELGNLLTAYPGNATLHQLRCDMLLTAKGVADREARAACDRVVALVPGDPRPHLAVGEALAKAQELGAARKELAAAEDKIANLPAGAAEAWRKLIATYQAMGALTWTEQAIAKAKLPDDPAAAQVAQTRARYGVPRGGKLVAPADEAALVTAVRGALDQVYASKYGDAERTIAAAERKWPRAAGLAAARCDLALRTGQVAGARAACARALAADANASWALYLAAVIDLREARGTRAGIAKLVRAIEVDPDLGQAWRTLAKAYAREGNQAALTTLAAKYQTRFGQQLPR